MNATTKILALACAGLLALAGSASAHHATNSATAYGAKLTGTAVSGRALLVDGKKNNILAVRVRGLKPNTAYTFGLGTASDFTPTTATTDANGKLKGFARSATFNADAGTTYTVQVKEGDAVVASGDLKQLPVRKRFGHRHHKRHHRHGAFKAQGGDPGHSNCDKAGQGQKA
ncbi:MAG TPA: hypothetical protein VH834_01755 [Solirubrobacteraceae bacterium]|jgi:hypothetical protein